MIAPFLLGLAGSLHCIGMCGPLVAAIHGGKNLLYNVGRILTYGLLGSLISLIGVGLNLAGIQQWTSIVVGIAILAISLTKLRLPTPRFMSKLIIQIKGRIKLNPFVLGMLNGFIPCGMTLVALGYCISVDGPFEGFISMMFFGLGTLPAMLGFSFVSSIVVRRIPGLQTTLMIIAGILLIGRGIDIEPHESHTDIVVCGTTLPHSSE